MKTREELNALKKEVEALNEKLHELNEEELAQVSGGLKDFSWEWTPDTPTYETSSYQN